MSQRLLEGDVVESNGDESEVDRLRQDLRRVAGERDSLRAENVRLRQRMNQVDAPVAQLRKTLEPLYRALQAMWGEIELIDPQVSATSQAGSVVSGAVESKSSPVWESWKQKLGGKQAEFISIFLDHGELTAAQLKAAARCSSDTVYQTIHRLNKAGLVSKNGGRFSLKSLS